MAKRTGPTNPNLALLIQQLRREGSVLKVPLWKRVAEVLNSSSRSRVEVNLSTLNRFCKKGEVIVVPGKVLGAGILEQEIVVAAYSFSANARQRILDIKGQCLSIPDLLKKNPKAVNVRLIG